ncbi:uncharacterized protein LOC122508195 [Leptopilina heterotoma]|uniref:uncharacterized protein LOC122508195 n=1 Tax=Leptopilina heterotoma TaxID=63436 RepID=UPI001CA87F12|nr:uncharacterized protein LOC122508195 [Leptopilina heterotoma]
MTEDSGIDSDPKNNVNLEDEILFAASDSSSSSSSNNSIINRRTATTKHLQRKLEARIEQAKRIQKSSEYMKLSNNDDCNVSPGIGIIPIQRLPIPQKKKKNLPLVELCNSDSGSEEEMALIPMSRTKIGNKILKDLTDPFSIEVLSEGSEDSLNLESIETSQSDTRTYTPSRCFSCQCHIL